MRNTAPFPNFQVRLFQGDNGVLRTELPEPVTSYNVRRLISVVSGQSQSAAKKRVNGLCRLENLEYVILSAVLLSEARFTRRTFGSL